MIGAIPSAAPAGLEGVLASSGLGLAASVQTPPAVQAGVAAAPQPVAAPASHASPFDRQDLVEIRGNVRPLAAEASVQLGASDEEGGGSPPQDDPRAGRAAEALRQKLEAAYARPEGRVPTAEGFLAAATAEARADRGAARVEGQRARQLREAFARREPERELGRAVDLAA